MVKGFISSTPSHFGPAKKVKPVKAASHNVQFKACMDVVNLSLYDSKLGMFALLLCSVKTSYFRHWIICTLYPNKTTI